MAKEIQVGSTVKYAKAWLRSIHASATDPLWFERGKVTAIRDLGSLRIATVEGFEPREDGTPAVVNVKNLARIDDLAALNLPD